MQKKYMFYDFMHIKCKTCKICDIRSIPMLTDENKILDNPDDIARKLQCPDSCDCKSEMTLRSSSD